MASLSLILLVFAFVFACIAVRWWQLGAPAWNFLALSIAFWILSEIVGGAARLGFLPH